MKEQTLQLKTAFRAVVIILLVGSVGMKIKAQGSAPTGAISGIFSVSADQQVYFSQGNLQYQASTNIWRFAENQWDYVGTQKPSYGGESGGTVSGSDNTNISSTYNGWIDLFGWGTSGYNHGAGCYQPWSTINFSSSYYAYGNSWSNLYSKTGQADWGWNAILNGGNQENCGWRTPTKEEWMYLFNTRSTSSGIRYASSQVNGVNGVILVPDNWDANYYSLSNTNVVAPYSSNILSISQWIILEQYGAVFLPATGQRDNENSVQDVVYGGYYWSSSYRSGDNAYYLNISDLRDLDAAKNYGHSVRLIRTCKGYPYSIIATPNLTEGGVASGSGTYEADTECTLTAIANENYAFVNWTESGVVVSSEPTYTFNVWRNRDLVANFKYHVSEGFVNGLFTVSTAKQVYFSQGNLQYQASTNTWRFADHQWDAMGAGNANISQTYDGWIDLFGWGTSGYSHGAFCYQPWSTNTSPSRYYAYGDYNMNLYNKTGKADWGYNPISNGGNYENQWRTLTKEEWEYVFNTRTTNSGVRYAKAQVNGVNGVILLPDDWDVSIYSLDNTNTPNASFSSNIISVTQWISLENSGVIFLPVTGYRYGTSVSDVDSYGNYWSASCSNGSIAYAVCFSGSSFNPQGNCERKYGESVRLVVPVENCFLSINATSSPIEVGMVSGEGSYEYGQTCTLTATANDDYYFVNWTKNGEVVSSEPEYTFSVTEDAEYVANFEDRTVYDNYLVYTVNDDRTTVTLTGHQYAEFGQNCPDCPDVTIVIPPTVTYNDHTYTVTAVGDNIFNGFTNLVSLSIPNTVITIGTNAFVECTGIRSITIPNSVNIIERRAFLDCNNLASVTVLSKTPPTLENSDAFENVSTDMVIYVPCESLGTYKTTTNWSDYANNMQCWMEQEITGYGNSTESDHWTFIASPVTSDVDPTTVDGLIAETATEYDLYRLTPGVSSIWENYKAHTEGFVFENGQGYLYANKNGANIIFKGDVFTGDYKDVNLQTGWNLVGNPYGQSAYINRNYYIMNADGSDVVPVSSSYTTTAIPVCTGVVVQGASNTDVVRFTKTARSKSAGNGNLQMTLAKAGVRGNELQDMAVVSFDENEQLGKFVFNEDHAKLYIPQNGEDYAIAYSNGQEEIPLYFKTKETAIYTINFENNAELKDAYLFDKFEGVVVNLNDDKSYTFIGSAADRPDRFVIRFKDYSDSESSIFAYQNGNEIIVNGEGNLQVFDIMGRMIAEQHVNGVETIAIPSQNGVYIIRLNEKNQKIVVR